MIERRSALVQVAALVAGLALVMGVACSAPELPAGSPTQTPNVTPVITLTTGLATSIVPTATTSPTSTPAPSLPAFPELEFIDHPDCGGISREQLSLADVEISDGVRNVSVVAEMARSPAEQSQGLMCRSSVPPGTGMLFLWDTERTGGFWMFNTYVPLDIIYFGNQAGDVAIREMTPCPRDGSETDVTWQSRCGAEASAYQPAISYTTTLELPQGWLEARGLNTAEPSGIVVSLKARS